MKIRPLAADYFPIVAKRDPSDDQLQAYDTVRYVAHARLDNITNISLRIPNNEWVMYGEYSSDRGAKGTLRLVSAIPLEYLIAARPRYQCDAERFLPGHTQDSIDNVIATMTGESCDKVRGSILSEPAAATAAL